MKLPWLLLLFSLIVSRLEIAKTRRRKKECSISRTNSVLAALEKAVQFYQQYGEDLNLDAYFGLRIAEGKNSVIHLSKHQTSSKCQVQYETFLLATISFQR